MIYASWGIGWNAERTRFHVGRCVYYGEKFSGYQVNKGASGRVLFYRSGEAAQRAADKLNRVSESPAAP